MNILKILFLIFLLILIGVVVYSYQQPPAPQAKPPRKIAKEAPPFEKGEKLIFKVNFKGINIGNAELVFDPNAKLDNQNVNFVRFLADLKNLYDLEEIYADKANYLPLKIKRKVKIFGQNMEIGEVYDQKQNFVKIQKNKNKEQKLQSDEPFNNIILMAYEFRKTKNLNLGDTFDFNFPTRKVKMKVLGIDKIRAPIGTYDAYRIESSPSKYRIWIDTGEKRLPLRLEGVAFLGLAVINLAEVK